MPEFTDWPVEAIALWRRLSAHSFENPEDGLDLTRRLAREQGWTLERARGAIDEYRRFCFLCCVAEEPLTPSQEVDEVWHLHLTYTMDYWQRFCSQVLGVALHHWPTRGGQAEGWRYREQYARTLTAYERWFRVPQIDFWPESRERFADPARIRRVDLRHHLVLPRPRLPSRRGLLAGVGLVIGALATAAASPFSSTTLTAAYICFVWLSFLCLSSTIVVGSWLWSARLRETGPAQADDLDTYQLAYLAGGPARAIDTGVTQLLTQDKVCVQGNPLRLCLTTPGSPLPAPLGDLGTGIALDGTRKAVLDNATAWIAQIRARLVSRGLALSVSQSWHIRVMGATPVLAVVALGVILLEWWRGGFLVVAIIVAAIVGLYRLLHDPIRTRAGDRALSDARRRFARLQRAPGSEELALAVALWGTTVLAHTAYADYLDVQAPKTHDGGGCGGGGDGGGSSGDGGCGGCGGCGGGG